MAKVLAFGTFDVLHKGHEFFLTTVRGYGDELIIVLARDETVLKIKGKPPFNDEKIRKKNLIDSRLVDKVFLGNVGDKYLIIERIRPDIICLGYDQSHFTEHLPRELKARKINAKIIRVNKSYKKNVYKSSLLRKKLEDQKQKKRRKR